MHIQNKNQPSPGFFGKLPKFPDFIKYNAGGQEILVIDKWIQDGIVTAKNKLKSLWKEYYRNSPIYNFYFPCTDTSNILIGTMFPSHDKSNREFPFIIFNNINRSYLRESPVWLIPIKFCESFERFNLLYSGFQENINPVNFELSDSSINDESENYQLFLTNTSQEEFWRRTIGSFDNHEKYAIVEKLLTQDFIKITFNLTREKLEFDLGFFIQLVLTIKSNTDLPTIFWSTDDYSACINIFLDKPSPKNYLNLIYQEDDGQIVQLNSNGEKNSYYKEILENKDISLFEILNSLGKNYVRNY